MSVLIVRKKAWPDGIVRRLIQYHLKPMRRHADYTVDLVTNEIGMHQLGLLMKSMVLSMASRDIRGAIYKDR